MVSKRSKSSIFRKALIILTVLCAAILLKFVVAFLIESALLEGQFQTNGVVVTAEYVGPVSGKELKRTVMFARYEYVFDDEKFVHDMKIFGVGNKQPESKISLCLLPESPEKVKENVTGCGS